MQTTTYQRTRSAYVWSHILGAPFWAIYNMLPYIMYKDLHATPLQITALLTIKPLVAILSMYWSSLIIKRRDRLLPNLNWAKMLGLLPFFFFPFINNVWLIIAFAGLFIMLARGVVPAWMEILKLNIPEAPRQKIFSYVSAVTYLGGGVLPLAFGWLMDDYFQAWRWIFPFVAFIAMLGLYFQYRILIPKDEINHEEPPSDLGNFLLTPWKKSWELFRARPDFAKFQIGFMLSGVGIMIWQPALPKFFIDVLNLSYTELALAVAFCKGIGFVVASPLWGTVMRQVSIFRFTAIVNLLAALFPLLLLGSQYHISLVYIAYLCYGVMQAGSEMCWNLSGPIFAKREDSSVYSSMNVLTVGVRGCIAPPFGNLLCALTYSPVVLCLGSALCLFSSWHLNAKALLHKSPQRQ